MASSSNKTHKIQNPLEEISHLGKEERGRDWLELGLGFSSCGYKKQQYEKSYPVSVSSSQLASHPAPFIVHQNHDQPQQQKDVGLGLGLGLGFDYKTVRCMNVAPPSNNHNMLWKDHQDYEHDLSLWQWQMGSSNAINWQTQMFYDSNDYSTSRRPHPGFWFTLISSTNRVGEALPQIPKAYIRVKDENMTVYTVKKYLVTKLGLSNEAEIDISCMGQNLLQTQTLKEVRDAVWLPRLIHSVNSTTLLFRNSQDMSMPLHYGRPCL